MIINELKIVKETNETVIWFNFNSLFQIQVFHFKVKSKKRKHIIEH